MTPEHNNTVPGKAAAKAAAQAAALKYSPDEDAAPVVIAAGYGAVAEKIIDIAEEKGIPVYKDEGAASLLCMLDVGSSIPPSLYAVVAAIYGQILAVSQKILESQNEADRSDRTGDK